MYWLWAWEGYQSTKRLKPDPTKVLIPVVTLWASLEKVLKVQNLRRCIGFGLGGGCQNAKVLKPESPKQNEYLWSAFGPPWKKF